MKCSLQYSSSYNLSFTKNLLILFLIWPFLAFVTAIINFQGSVSRRIIYLFFIYYGLTFVLYEGMDSVRFVDYFEYNAELPFSEFSNIVGGLYAEDSSVDIIEPLISFVVSRFTSNYGFLFAAYAALYGYFYLKSIKLLYSKRKNRSELYSLLFLALFSLILPVTNIFAVRMWAAAWIFFFGAYHIILYRKRTFFLITLLACLMHWSFLIVNVILFIYYFVGNRNYIYIPILIVSFIAPGILMPVIGSLTSDVGGSLQNRYDNYTGEAYSAVYQENLLQSNSLISMNADILFYTLIVAILIISIWYRNYMMKKEDQNLLSFMILFMALINFGQYIPNFGFRFKTVFMLFATMYIYLFHTRIPDHKNNVIPALVIFPMLLYVLVAFRITSFTINAWIIMPGLGLPFFIPELTLGELIFG